MYDGKTTNLANISECNGCKWFNTCEKDQIACGEVWSKYNYEKLKCKGVCLRGVTGQRYRDCEFMIHELAPEHEQLIASMIEEYCYRKTLDINVDEVKQSVKFLYERSGIMPDILIFDSPAELLKYCKDNHTYYTPIIKNTLDLIVAVARSNVCDVVQPVKEEVDRKLRQRVRSVLERIIRQSEFELKLSSGGVIGETMLYDWVAYHDFFTRIGCTNHKEKNIFDEYLNFIRTSNSYVCVCTLKSVLLCKRPLLTIQDDKNRLNNTEGPAVQFSDGYSQYYINGVFFDEKLFLEIFIHKTITPKEILNIRNAEQKVIALKHYGYDRVISELNAKKLDTWKTKSLVNGNWAECELYEFELEFSRWSKNVYRFVKVQDHSTGKVTTLAVPIEKQTNTAKGAVSWTFGMTEEEYNPYYET